MECQNRWFSRCLSSVWPVVALRKSQNALKMGIFGTKDGSKMGKNGVFQKSSQIVWGALESQNALKRGCFGTKDKSKMHPKCVFPKMLLDYLGCMDKWNKPILGPCWPISAPLKAKRALEMGQFGPIWANLGAQMVQKRVETMASKIDPSPVVVPKWMNTAHFGALLSRSHPFSNGYLICCWSVPYAVPSPTSSVTTFNAD